MQNLSTQDKILIVGIIPYFLEKGCIWFEQNLKKILEARKTQSFFEDNTLYLEKNQKYNFSQLLRKLDEMGYEKVFKISEPGEFSQRGGIIDVFSINSKSAYRLDFLGDKIESIAQLPIVIKDEKTSKEILKKKLKSQRLFSDLKNLKTGDYLVHLDHGVGKFTGLFSHKTAKKISNKIMTDRTLFYIIEYAQGDKLYVPIGLERKLSRYIGFIKPKISRLGSSLWQKTKRKIKEGVEKFARELLEIYAKREIVRRPPYLPDEEIQQHLASSFLYEETPDQIQAIEDIKKDMEKMEPMDRIICGDVGFGKTEVSLRAIIKAVVSGRQAAMICPTTILANQHFQNFRERLKNLPIKIAMLSRLQSKKEQREIIKNLEGDKIDIIVGTHRLLSKDITPHLFEKSEGLGLLVIDDEHKFGVKQKEKFKKIRTSLDVLSLSATPIPRTLYMALSSLKEISLIQIPPRGRMAIKTFVLPYNQKVIKKAIENELKRGGQVYYLHNRVETISKVKEKLEKLVPSAKIGIIHGRMKEREMIKVMDSFANYSYANFEKEKIHPVKYRSPSKIVPKAILPGQAVISSKAKLFNGVNVLLATTIIENGLDIPKVNTLIVEDSTRLGLSQAYQIRGRIGRSYIQSFAYFFYPQRLLGLAKQRLVALKEAEELGSGYRIAMKDLEIRGAGNILGKEQSGSINQVGLNLYCQLLSEAVEKLKICDF